jgi:putative salt-induced outer membrane protein YdiY
VIKRGLKLHIAIILSVAYSVCASADEVYLKNNDRISGIVIEQAEDYVLVETKDMGQVSIRASSVERIVRQDKGLVEAAEAVTVPRIYQEEAPSGFVEWKRELSAGFNRTTGNTREDSFAGGFLVSRISKHVDEWTAKGNLFYSSKNRKMDKQKWYLMGRYAYSFGSAKKWYNFYRIEAEHDRFADIDYRLVPAGGFGYWFFDSEETKLMAEVGGGLEQTYYKSDIKSGSEWVLIPRAWLEKRIFENITFRQGVSYYPTFEDFNSYRIRSETAIDFAINSHLKLRFSMWDDYNSRPTEGTKKNDLRAITSLAYSF